MVTTDTILDWLESQIENKEIVDAHTWIDAAQKMNILSGQEHDKLYILQQDVSKAKVLHLESGKSVAEAKTRVESSDLYREMKTQEAKIKRVEESVRISKLMAKLKSNEISGY